MSLSPDRNSSPHQLEARKSPTPAEAGLASYALVSHMQTGLQVPTQVRKEMRGSVLGGIDASGADEEVLQDPTGLYSRERTKQIMKSSASGPTGIHPAKSRFGMVDRNSATFAISLKQPLDCRSSLRRHWSITEKNGLPPPQIASGSTSIAHRIRLLKSPSCRVWCNTGCQAARKRCNAAREGLSTSICARSILATRWMVMGTAG